MKDEQHNDLKKAKLHVESLLTVKEAAAFINVSEMTIFHILF